jgi:DHA1 family inner membrane transport protein
VGRSLIFLAFGNFAIASGVFVVPGVLAPLSEGLGMSVANAGQLLTVYAVAYAIGSPLLAALTSHWDRRRLVMTGLAVFSAANLVFALADGPGLAFVARIVAAFGAGVFTPTVTYVVATTSPPDRRGRNLSIAFLGLSVAQVVGIPAATYLGFAFGWRAAFFAVAALGAIGWLSLLATMPKGIRGQRISGAAWRAIARDWRLLLAIAVTVLQFSGQFAAYTYIGPLLAAENGLDADGITAVLFAFGAASIVGGLAGGWLSDRIGPYRAIMIALVAMTGGLALLTVGSGSLLVTVAALSLWALFGFAYNTPQQARLIGMAGQAQTIVLAMNASAVYIGTATGGVVGGLTTAAWGYGALGAAGAVLSALGVAALWLSRPKAAALR